MRPRPKPHTVDQLKENLAEIKAAGGAHITLAKHFSRIGNGTDEAKKYAKHYYDTKGNP